MKTLVIENSNLVHSFPKCVDSDQTKEFGRFIEKVQGSEMLFCLIDRHVMGWRNLHRFQI